jgi:16S rRNA processing protein RimM
VKDNFVTIGKIGAPHGVHGFIKLVSFTEPATKILEYQPIYLKDRDCRRQFVVQEHKVFKNGAILVKLSGVENPEDARLLTGLELIMPRESLPEITDGGYYWHDLVGLNARLPSGTVLGVVDYLFNAGASDIIVVKPDNGKDILIPYIDSVVLNVDLESGFIDVDWEI